MGSFNRGFNRDSRPGGGRSFNRGTRDRELFRTTCSNCGKECEVPFKPTGSKPVFCSECFQRNGGETRRANDRDYASRRPSFQHPQYNEPQRNEHPEQNNDQFASLNAKLDKIIALLDQKTLAQSKAEEPALIVEKKLDLKKSKPPAKAAK